MTKRGRPFEPGNKLGLGRPRGSRNKTPQKMREILESQSENLMKTAIVAALKGDKKVLMGLLGHLFGRSGGSPVKMRTLKFKTIQDLSQSSETLLNQVAAGKITPVEASQMFEFIETRRRVLMGVVVEERVQKLELPASPKLAA